MALRDNTLIEVMNAGLRVIGEPSITSLTAANLLEQTLIDDINETVTNILEAARYEWGLFRDAFATVAELTTGTVSATNGSTTVTSLDDDGANAQNFTNVVAGDWVRLAADQTSYEVASVDAVSDPNTITLADAYLGTTTTSSSYRVIRDQYTVTTTNLLDNIVRIRYGDSPSFNGKDAVSYTDVQTIMNMAQGDLHRDTSGKPRFIAEVGPDTSANRQWLLWPYPGEALLMELWYTQRFSAVTTDSTVIFGSDAPTIAYDAVRHHTRWRACVWDQNEGDAQKWMGLYERAHGQIIARTNREMRVDQQQARVNTYRRGRVRRAIMTQSQNLFDRV